MSVVEDGGGKVKRMKPVCVVPGVAFLRFCVLKLMIHNSDCCVKLTVALADLLASATA